MAANVDLNIGLTGNALEEAKSLSGSFRKLNTLIMEGKIRLQEQEKQLGSMSSLEKSIFLRRKREHESLTRLQFLSHSKNIQNINKFIAKIKISASEQITGLKRVDATEKKTDAARATRKAAARSKWKLTQAERVAAKKRESDLDHMEAKREDARRTRIRNKWKATMAERKRIKRDEFNRDWTQAKAHDRWLDKQARKEETMSRKRIAQQRRETREIERGTKAWRQRGRAMSRAFLNFKPAGGRGAGTLASGATRLGGFMPNSLAGTALRQTVTGGLLGGGFGQVGGGIARTAFGGIGALGGSLFGPVGGAIGGTAGNVAGTALGAVGTFKGATLGASAGLLMGAAQTLTKAVGGLARYASQFGRRALGVGRRVAYAGAAGAGALIGGGLVAAGGRQQAEQALATVGKGDAPALGALARRGRPFFSKSQRLRALSQGVAFGLPAEIAAEFLPKVENAAAVFGTDVGTGLKAIPRAAYQGETELAEQIGLNLREASVQQTLGRKVNFDNPREKAQATIEAARIQLRKFEGGVERISQTIPGVRRAVTSGGEDFLTRLGLSFASKDAFDLSGRGGRLAGFLGGKSGASAADKIGGALGRGAGGALDFIKNVAVPKAREFFSPESEGTGTSAAGDMFFKHLAALPGYIKTAADNAKELWGWLKKAGSSLFEFLTGTSEYKGISGFLIDEWQKFFTAVKETRWEDAFKTFSSAAKTALLKVDAWITSAIANIAKNAFMEATADVTPQSVGGAAVGGVLGMAKAAYPHTFLGRAHTAALDYVEGPTPTGGLASGGFTPGSHGGHESIARVHGGEYVMPKRHVDSFRAAGAMGAISSGQLPGFASGAFVSAAQVGQLARQAGRRRGINPAGHSILSSHLPFNRESFEPEYGYWGRRGAARRKRQVIDYAANWDVSVGPGSPPYDPRHSPPNEPRKINRYLAQFGASIPRAARTYGAQFQSGLSRGTNANGVGESVRYGQYASEIATAQAEQAGRPLDGYAAVMPDGYRSPMRSPYHARGQGFRAPFAQSMVGSLYRGQTPVGTNYNQTDPNAGSYAAGSGGMWGRWVAGGRAGATAALTPGTYKPNDPAPGVPEGPDVGAIFGQLQSFLGGLGGVQGNPLLGGGGGAQMNPMIFHGPVYNNGDRNQASVEASVVGRA